MSYNDLVSRTGIVRAGVYGSGTLTQAFTGGARYIAAEYNGGAAIQMQGLSLKQVLLRCSSRC
jgi:hypothetical protein